MKRTSQMNDAEFLAFIADKPVSGGDGTCDGSQVAPTGIPESTLTRGDTQTGSMKGSLLYLGKGSQSSDYQKICQQVPAQTTVGLSGAGVTACGNSPSQFKCTKSLVAGAFTLVGHVMTAAGCGLRWPMAGAITPVNTDPAVAPYVWISSNSHVASVSQSGVVTPLRIGQVEIRCTYPRSANLPVLGGTPSGTDAAEAVCVCQIVP
jgi:hypothetical protein